MQKIIYYVAVSIDGYIAGHGVDTSQFLHQGPSVARYQADLLRFKTVLMGRKTYETGYDYGLKPGQPAYQGMKHYIFSGQLALPNPHPDVSVVGLSTQTIKSIKAESATDIYLCGGGMLAGWLATHRLIDQLKIKLNPVALGGGTKLFGHMARPVGWQRVAVEAFDDGMAIITYNRPST